jgi:hypothetical protein
MQPLAKIYQPAKTAMQSGRGKTKRWKLEYMPLAKGTPDALMGWNTMPDTRVQLQLEFPSREEAIAYATAKGIPFEVIEPKLPQVKPKSYAENFAFTKRKAYDSHC